MSQIAFEMPSRPKPWTRPARRSRRTSASASPDRVAGLGRRGRRPPARGRGSTATSGRRSSRSRASAASKRVAGEHDRERRLGVDHRVPRRDRVEAARADRSASASRRSASAGSNCLPAPLTRQRLSQPRPRRRGSRPRRTPRPARSARPAEPRRPRARPASRARPSARTPQPSASSTASGSPSCSPSVAGDRRVVRDHAVDLAVAGERELEPEPEAVQRRLARAEQAHARRRHPQAARLVLVLGRLQRDVVAEPLGLLVRVGVAADVDEQRRVVDRRALLLVEPEPLGQPQRDQALPQHVLHRLPEAEVDAQRQRRDELGEANAPRAPSLRPQGDPTAVGVTGLSRDAFQLRFKASERPLKSPPQARSATLKSHCSNGGRDSMRSTR